MNDNQVHAHSHAPGTCYACDRARDQAHRAAVRAADAACLPAVVRSVSGAPTPEVVGADNGHWAASAHPTDSGAQAITCECGLPWTQGSGCAFVQGAAAQRAATVE